MPDDRIYFSCACGKQFFATPDRAGGMTTCPECSRMILIPHPPPAEPPDELAAAVDGFRSALDVLALAVAIAAAIGMLAGAGLLIAGCASEGRSSPDMFGYTYAVSRPDATLILAGVSSFAWGLLGALAARVLYRLYDLAGALGARGSKRD